MVIVGSVYGQTGRDLWGCGGTAFEQSGESLGAQWAVFPLEWEHKHSSL